MWTHKSQGKKLYKGSYGRFKGERVFELNNGTRTVTFESWQMAKKLGWRKV